MFEQIIESFHKNKKGIIYILCSAVCTSLGQALWKLFSENQWIFLISGFILYFFGAVLMIVAFRHGSLSVLHPLLSVGYLFALVIGYFLLNEAVSPKELLGIVIILIGVLLIGGGDH
ncbi:hypothetical protein C162_12481 [Paenibacillus sp. FSL R7-269]|uniref:EamA family transporter n=1 Tax=Paenibacillus sp. FSL R7-269 TaxID=1226755 RepID=UPI0003E25D6D|nr:EamA family transporter [Paenibacillus sp. FSL R7-269]ETT50053.1 hypothetical protein C162_12481 [Paenibacillus sp. FSL R7-269]